MKGFTNYLNFVIRKNIRQVLPCALFLIVTACISIPSVLFLSNINEFLVDYVDIVPSILIGSIIVTAVSLLICLLNNKTLFEKSCCLLFSMALGFYIQAQFLNPPFDPLNGSEINWTQYQNYTILSCVIWTLVIIIPQICHSFISKKVNRVLQYISCFFSNVQIISLFIVIITTKRDVSNDYAITVKDEFRLSNSKNTIVFVLDTLDAEVFEDYVLNDSYYRTSLKDFYYFDNVVAGGAPTILGIPAMLTGRLHDGISSVDKYQEEAYSSSTLLKDFKNGGVSVRYYSLNYLLNHTDFNMIDNAVTEVDYKVSSYAHFTKYLYKLTAFTCMPLPLKPPFWMYGNVFNDLSVLSDDRYSTWALDNIEFYHRFMDSGLSINDSCSKMFTFYHLIGVHAPYTMDEQRQVIPTTSDISYLQGQARGCFQIVFEYIEQMKRLGIYEDSTIIITGDHGGIDLYINPAILIKVPGTMESMKILSEPVTFINLYNTFGSSLLTETESYIENDLFHSDGNSIRYHTASNHLLRKVWGMDAAKNDGYTRLRVSGDARDLSNVEIVENSHSYKVGETLSFQYDATANPYCISGFGENERTGTWTVSESAIMFFELEADDDLILEMSFITYLGEQQLSVYANGHKVGTVVENGDCTIAFQIPHTYIEDSQLTLLFELPDAIVPTETDSRKLALRMHTIGLYDTEHRINNEQ